MKKNRENISDNQISILVIDDEPIALKAISSILNAEGYNVKSTTKGQKAIDMVKTDNFGVVLTDLLIDSVNGLDILAAVKERCSETEVIILTGYASIDSAIQATKQGAFHYLQKPIRPDEVRNIVRRAVERLQLTAKIQELQAGSENEFPSIIGSSTKIVEIKKLIRRIKDSDSNVMITGESGTGKELVAKAIHEKSHRRKEKFIAFNCASFTEDLIANELFGHEKDAFTGATRSVPGLLESADKGTVFLDEAGDMPHAMQVKLLRVIQERELMRVGGTEPIPVDIRIIAATNKDLKKLCTSGYFRQDLFFRLNVIPVHMPNLNERREDIALLGSHFLKQCAEKTGKTIAGFSDEVIGRLGSYGYPGNIRELENIVEHAVSMADGNIIKIENLPKDIMEYDLYTFHSEEEKLKSLGEMEKEYIRWVLDRVKHNKTEAAKILNIDRVSLYRKLKRYTFEDE
jgi:DNA-binding NtrC family response regulator